MRETGRVPKWAKTIIAILLLPVCYGAARALWRVLAASGGADTFWVAFLSGAACWLGIFFLLPRPMLVYVFGHELTHAVWTWLMGGRVMKFKASADGGYVKTTKTNFLIALAPYFFPLYAVLVLLLFLAGNAVWDWRRQVVWLHLLLGVAYSFHVTLTLETLRTHQSDITSQGYLFSATVIFLGNVAVLLIGLPLLTAEVNPATAFRWWADDTLQAVAFISATCLGWARLGGR